jgi:hypothetical protein
MWVWVAMRCFFEVDCTSSILIAANNAGYALSVSVELPKFGGGGWEMGRGRRASATGLLWEVVLSVLPPRLGGVWDCGSKGVAGPAGLGLLLGRGRGLGLSAFIFRSCLNVLGHVQRN